MEKYLLGETPEAIEMRGKITQMFFSQVPENILLAVQLIEGGGLPLDLMPCIWVLPFMEEKPVKDTKINAMLRKALQPDTYALFTKMRRKFKKESEWEYVLSEEWMDKNLEKLRACEETAPYLKEFACSFLYMLRIGGRYILQQNILPEEEILRAIIQNEKLSFNNFGLKTLPACIGKFTEIKVLDLLGNNLSDVPDSLADLKNLEYIYLDSEVEDMVMNKLDSFFPEIMSAHYNQIGSMHMKFNEVEKAIQAYQKAVALKEDIGELWNELAYAYSHALQFEKALETNEKAIALAQTTTEKATYLSNKASDEQRYGLSQKSIETSQEVLTLLSTVPEKQWEESDFFSYALSSHIVGKHEEALEYYEKYDIMGFHKYDSSLHYNKACVYARLGRREEMVDMIKKAIQSDNIDWIAEMRHDLDFQAYWQDDILDELQKEYDEKLPF